MMERRVILVFITLAISASLFAQSYHSLRVAGGVSITSNTELEPEYSLKVGPSLLMAYTRGFNQYLSAEAELSSAFVNNSNTAQSVFFDVGVNCLVTPLAKVFRYLELGAGLAVRYDRYTVPHGDRNENDDIVINCSDVFDSREIIMGINYCIRLYAIRNDRFDLFAYYEPKTNFSKDFTNYYWRSSYAGIAFGVKF